MSKGQNPSVISSMDFTDFLKVKIQERTSSLTDAFRKLDVSNNGVITPGDLEVVLRNFGMRVTRQDINGIIATFDTNGDGYITYAEFCTRLASGSGSGAAGLKHTPALAVNTLSQQTEEKLRRSLLASAGTLTAAFLKIDKNRDGVCDKEELATMFRNANMALSAGELDALVAKYDVNGDGQLDIRELAALLSATPRFAGHQDRGHMPAAKRAKY